MSEQFAVPERALKMPPKVILSKVILGKRELASNQSSRLLLRYTFNPSHFLSSLNTDVAMVA